MNLTGKYTLRKTIGGQTISVDTSTGLAVFASFDNTETAKAAIGAFVANVARDGGTVYDADAKQYIAGPLGLLTEDGTLQLAAETA